MRKVTAAAAVLLAMGALLLPGEQAVWGQALSAPVITSVSPGTQTRSGRLIIQGSGFGATQGGAYVDIGGLPAPVTRWSDALIAAYVPEAVPVGAALVQVVTGGGSSNAVPVAVTLRQAAGRVKWRFQADSSYVLQRPALGPDGTIVVHDSGGFAYSLSPDGALRWIFRTPAFAYGPPSIGPDGTAYVTSLSTVWALDPDGTVKWQFTDPNLTQGAIAGPTVGPDGNIYVVNDLGGLGAFALSPGGQLLWSNPGNPTVFEYGQIGAAVVFGPRQPGGPTDQLYVAFDRGPFSAPHRWGFTLGGSQRWAVPTGGQTDVFMQFQSQPAVGPDGTVYMTSLLPRTGWGLEAIDPATGTAKWSWYEFPGNGASAPDVGPDGVIYFARNLASLHAFNPDGTERWRAGDGSIVDHPIASPTNSLIFAGGRPDFGMPGFARGYSPAAGQPVFTVDLGVENGGNQILYTRSRFTPDGLTVYFGTAVLGGSDVNPYSYVYALDASTAPADTVAIQRAVYVSATRRLRVRATSTSAAATLTVYVTATNELIGTLKNDGGGSYSGRFRWPVNPQNITVRSDLGGSATRAVKLK